MNFDLHTHVSLKTMLGETTNAKRKSCWDKINSNLLDKVSGGIIGSQSSLMQIKTGNVQIAVTALYSLEYAFATNWLLKDVLTAIEKKLSKKLLQSISDNKLSPYENLKQELKHIEDASNTKMKIIHDNSSFDNTKINIILATEGLHNFQNKYVDNKTTLVNDIKTNLKEFILKNRVLYTGLAHLTRNVICTHSYAMKMISDIEFVPEGAGLTQAAKDMIDICYSATGKNGKRTFIDIKHMSIVSRMQFYEYRNLKGYTTIPIVASHFAVTGNSLNNIKTKEIKVSTKYANTIEIKHQRTYSDVVCKFDTTPIPELIDFNPWSLNLYDEEINLIIESGGIIGMILDKRVLGTTFNNNDPEGVEYFSKESYNYLVDGNHFNPIIGDEFEADEDFDLDSIKGSRGCMHLFANLLHIVKTFHKKYGTLQAWDHICIGSDSDGLISPIEDYGTAADFENLRTELLNVFEAERKRDYFKIYFGNLDSTVLINKVFYSNGTKFINNNL